MGNYVAEVVQALPHSHANIKVHRLMCKELIKVVDRILQILPAIESAQPQCMTGIQALCSLNLAIEKAKLLLQHCAESSKLYLAITGEAIVLRCEKVRNALELSLTQIQNIVPLLLVAQISGIVDDLRVAKFMIESSEEEAGKVVLALLLRDTSAADSLETSEFEAFQLAAVRLHLTSPKALLIEKRSVKNLLDKVRDTDQTKERILNYLLYLLRKYGKSIGSEQTEDASAQCKGSLSSTNSVCSNAVCGWSIEQEPFVQYRYDEPQAEMSKIPIPPEVFRCSLSLGLMHDPVVIASGQTFERVWIEKWFNEGHDTCPKTQKKLSHLSMTPNSAIKDLISKWCRSHGIPFPDPCSQPTPAALYSWKTSSSSSITSFGSSLNDVYIQTDVNNVSLDSLDSSNGSDTLHVKIIDGSSLVPPQMNDNSHRCQSSSHFSYSMSSGLLLKLAELPWESQCKIVDDIRNNLKEDDQAFPSMLSNSSVQTLIRFLKDACNLYDVKAQRDGAQVLLALVSKSRNEIPSLCEDVFYLLAYFLDSEITEEALSIIEVLSGYPYCKSKITASGAIPSILKILDTQIREFHAPAVKILYNLSLNRDIGSHILSLGCIPKLIPLLGDSSLAGHCLKILKILCNIEEAIVVLSGTDRFIASIAELLEAGTHEEQEHAVAVLLSLCSQHIEFGQLVLKEGIIPSLVNLSVNGNTRGKESAIGLLLLLGDIRYSDSIESLLPYPGSNPEFSHDPSNCPIEKKTSSKARGFFGRKLAVFSKPRS